METGLATAPLQRQATGTGGGSGMVPGATNIMMPLANLASQAGQQQYVNPFAGAQFNFPVVQPAQTVGATYNITTGAAGFDWQKYLDDLLAGTTTDTGTTTTDTGTGTTTDTGTGTEVVTTTGTVPFDTSGLGTAGWDYTKGLPPWEKPTIPAGYSGPEPFSGWGAQAPSYLRGTAGWGIDQARNLAASRFLGGPTGITQVAGTSRLLGTSPLAYTGPGLRGGSVTAMPGVGYFNQGIDFSGMPSVDVLAARQAAASRGGGGGGDDSPHPAEVGSGGRDDDNRQEVERLVAAHVDRTIAQGVVDLKNREDKRKDPDPVADHISRIEQNKAAAKAANETIAASKAYGAGTGDYGVGTFRKTDGGFVGGF